MNKFINKSLLLSWSSAERKKKILQKHLGVSQSEITSKTQKKNPNSEISSMFMSHEKGFLFVSYHGTTDPTARTGLQDLTGKRLVYFGLIAEVVFCFLLMNQIWTLVVYQFWSFCSSSLPYFFFVFCSLPSLSFTKSSDLVSSFISIDVFLSHTVFHYFEGLTLT